MLKKYRGSFAHVQGGPGHSTWESFQARWEAMPVDEIIELSAKWGTRPTIRDVQFGGSGY